MEQGNFSLTKVTWILWSHMVHGATPGLLRQSKNWGTGDSSSVLTAHSHMQHDHHVTSCVRGWICQWKRGTIHKDFRRRRIQSSSPPFQVIYNHKSKNILFINYWKSKSIFLDTEICNKSCQSEIPDKCCPRTKIISISYWESHPILSGPESWTVVLSLEKRLTQDIPLTWNYT